MPGRTDVSLASMGIYVFETHFLFDELRRDAADPESEHDFGKNIIPRIVDAGKAVAHPFERSCVRSQDEKSAYWRDVGTLDAYYAANIDLTDVVPELDIYDQDWPIWTYQVQQPPAKFILDEDGRRGTALNSMVSGGCIISGAVVRESLLFSNVRVEEGTSIARSVVLNNVEIGRSCKVQGAILDEGCEVPDGTQIGVDRAADARRFHVTENGVVLVTPDMLRRLRTEA
jgi:glucose-1-phosphate adenylyltransferase